MEKFVFLEGWYMDIYLFTKFPDREIMALLSEDPEEKERAFLVSYETSS